MSDPAFARDPSLALRMTVGMAKKKRKNRKARKQENKKIIVQKPEEPTTVVDVRADLRKTAILTTVCLGILFLLYLTQSRWSSILK